GDIEEGVTSEASSLAGTQQLGNLVVFYDDNKISIEDDTTIALSEDTAARYEAYGWHVQVVESGENVKGILEAVEKAKAVTDKPSFILLRTIIGYPAPNKQNTGAAHGSALGVDEVKATKEILGFDPEQSFEVADEVLAHAREVVKRGEHAKAEWQKSFDAWASANGENKALLDRLVARELPQGWDADLPAYEVGGKEISTRKASGEAINGLAKHLPELWGGSADLAESNLTTIKDAKSFGPASISTSMWNADPYGRVLHFGVRENAMGMILNGIALHGPTRPFGGTFLVFSDYMRPAVRLAAIMQAAVTYVWTHDSIGLGEDGPTHQPIEHLAALRAIPDFAVVRPGDANETAYAWKATIEQLGPVGFALSRQNLPILEGTSAEGVKRGGYVLFGDENPEIVIIGTGSELQVAAEAGKVLQGQGVAVRVVSMPSVEWFEKQDAEYRESVLPSSVKARVAVEAGIAQPWYRYVGDNGEIVSIEHFGASADYQVLFKEFGLTTEDVVAAAGRSLDRVRGTK
ncbi:transketolase, partial [Lentzea sp.]|uniref:transketolase family protein n=1 Tax=Lentzea sp. TaxID=56099 RepID=UPI002C673EFE